MCSVVSCMFPPGPHYYACSQTHIQNICSFIKPHCHDHQQIIICTLQCTQTLHMNRRRYTVCTLTTHTNTRTNTHTHTDGNAFTQSSPQHNKKRGSGCKCTQICSQHVFQCNDFKQGIACSHTSTTTHAYGALHG